MFTWVFYLLIFFLPFQNHQLVNATVGPITILKAVGSFLLVLALVQAASRGFPRIWKSTPAKAILFFTVWTILSWLFAGYALAGLQAWETYGVSNVLSVIIFLLITLVVIESEAKLRQMILVCVASMSLGGIYLIRDFFGGDDRPGWPFQDANYYALYAVTVLPIALAALRTEKRKLYRLGCYTSITLCLIGLLLSASRAGFLVLLMFALIQVVRGKQASQKIWLMAVLLVASLFMAPRAIQRLTNPTKSDLESNFAHKTLAKAAFYAMLEHPFLGVGPSSAYFKGYLEETGAPFYGVPHNTFLEIGATSGVPALATYLFMIGSSLVLLRRRGKEFTRANSPYLEGLARALQFSLINSSLMGLTLSGSYIRFIWFVFILVILLNEKRFDSATQTHSAEENSAQPQALANWQMRRASYGGPGGQG